MALILEICNVSPVGSETAEWANYVYKVRIAGEVVESGEIRGHFRPWGWVPLVKKLLATRTSTTPSNT